jgi:hypothetical protein
MMAQAAENGLPNNADSAIPREPVWLPSQGAASALNATPPLLRNVSGALVLLVGPKMYQAPH